MVSGVLCIEVLIVTILSWVGLWGLVEEILEPITNKKLRCLIYCLLLCVALLCAGLQKQVTICGLL